MPRSRPRAPGALAPAAVAAVAVVAAAGATVGLSLLLAARGLVPWLAVSVSAFAVTGWALALSLLARRWSPSPRRTAGRTRFRPVNHSPRAGGEPGRVPRGRVVLAVLWTALLVVGLLLPKLLSDRLSVLAGPEVQHAIGFAGFTWLWVRVFPRAALRVALVAAAFAGASELAQWLLPALGRGASLGDALADVVGIALGLVPGLIAYGRRRADGRRAASPPGRRKPRAARRPSPPELSGARRPGRTGGGA